jgi:hypothetical protein
MHKQVRKARKQISELQYYCFIETCFCCRMQRKLGKPLSNRARRRFDRWIIEEELEELEDGKEEQTK